MFFCKIFRSETPAPDESLRSRTLHLLRHLLSLFPIFLLLPLFMIIVISNTPAAPIPPPIHIVTMPNCTFLRLISWINVNVNFVPVQPSGCPSAIAPPLTLTFSSLMPSRRMTWIACDANASFNSNQTDIRQLKSRHLQRPWDCFHRADAHHFRRNSRRRRRNEILRGALIQCVRFFSVHDHHCGSPVTRLRGIPCRYRAVCRKAGFNVDQYVFICLRAYTFVGRESKDVLPSGL